MKKLACAALLAHALLASCKGTPDAVGDPVPTSSNEIGWAEVPGSATPVPDSGPLEMDWDAVTPVEFLDVLASNETGIFTIWNTPSESWFDRAHLDALVASLSSDEQATPVVSSLSSMLPLGESSTVGREAAFLIEGYRVGRYPPRLSSVHYFEYDPAELAAWWTGQRQ